MSGHPITLRNLKLALLMSAMAFVTRAAAENFDIPGGDLKAALDNYARKTSVQLIYSADAVLGTKTKGVKGDLSADDALSRILENTGFVIHRHSGGTVAIVRTERRSDNATSIDIAAAPATSAPGAALETVTVTSSKIGGDVQNIPISISAFSQEQLTARQISGGPDLVKEVPNLTFSKTNFTGYNLEIRGIGTQAISVTTDPAVAVAFNDTPFLRNHFFEQEFFDVSQVQVLRGPQGTLYGRNATAGVVNVVSAKPTDQYEAMLSGDLGNFNNRRLEGMLNIPIVGDTLDIRVAGEWTKRDGYTEDTTLDTSVDGRDLWSTRMTIGWKPASNVQTDLVWEHFSEDDDRLRSSKQLCETDYGPDGVPPNGNNVGYNVVNGVAKAIGSNGGATGFYIAGDYFVQGCLPDESLYSPQAFEAPLGYALPYILGASGLGILTGGNPYGGVTQSTNLRSIESEILPQYAAKNDTLEFNANWNVTPDLTFTSQTGYNHDALGSIEDFNRFGATPGFFVPGIYGGLVNSDGVFCDPQLGCSDRLVVEDVSTERAWQLSQEFRLSSNFSGPLNFTAGGNYLHYETLEKYYVLSNVLTLISCGAPDCLSGTLRPPLGYRYNPLGVGYTVSNGYVDPNPLSSLNDEGHNYYLNQNPYVLNSYAMFGEANYELTKTLKFIAGLRWTDDRKHFSEIPSWLATEGYGYPITGVIDQGWERFTGRAVVNWTPKLDFTDQTLIYGSYAHGYKAGGANPPGAIFTASEQFGLQQADVNPIHPLTFKPEYIEAFELGTKNTLLDGALTFNGDVFYYNYHGYQVSEIVDRTAINTNYNAHVEGAEIESSWEPLAGLRFGFAGGFEDARLAGGTEAVDLMDRTAGHPGWYLVKPFVTEASNCIFPGYVAQYFLSGTPTVGGQAASFCAIAYDFGLDPLTQAPYSNPTAPLKGSLNTIPGVYPGFDPRAGTPGDPYTGQNTGDLCVQNCAGTGTPVYTTFDYGPVPNNGQGFSKNLSGNQLPNAPHFTASLTGEYTIPVSQDWAATLHADFYWQAQQWARVFEDPIDKIKGYENLNLSLVFSSAKGWQVMGYVKNVFDTTAITGTFLNSDDTGLTTNVFLTDPRLFGVRVTKHLDQDEGFTSHDDGGNSFFTGLFSDTDGGKPPLWIELGGGFDRLQNSEQAFAPPFYSTFTKPLTSPAPFEHPASGSFDYDAKLSYEPDGTDWVFSAAVRYGRTGRNNHTHQTQYIGKTVITVFGQHVYDTPPNARYLDAFDSSSETHEILDFAAGKDVGLGMFGLNGDSEISGGLRFVQFSRSSAFSIHADPDYAFNKLGPKYHHHFTAADQSQRSFHGIGPSLSWNASTSVVKSADTGGVSVDWGLNAALLFGRQIANVHHHTTGAYTCLPLFNGGCHQGTVIGSGAGAKYQTHYQRSGPAQKTRSRRVTVPNVGAFAGLSWRYANAKVSFGYRADEFFGAMDGGNDTRKSENVGFFGPYAHLSVGLGG